MGGYGVRTVFLMVLMAGLLMVIGYAFGGTTWLIIFGVIAIAMNFFSYWKSDSIIRTAMGAQEVTAQQQPMLHRIVERAAVDAELPKPKIYVVDTPVPNAFATGRSPNHAAVAATTGIMSILTERELAGVMAHEMAHVKNRDTLWSTMVAMMASVIMLVAMLAKWSLMLAFLFGGMGGNNEQGGGVGHLAAMLVLAFVAPVIAGMIQMAVSRQREYGADEMGARNSRDPHALASALTKLQAASQSPQARHAAEEMATAEVANHLFIVNPLAGGAGKWFSSHPPTEDRVERLRQLGREIGQIF